MRRLQTAVVIVVVAYALLNGLAGFSLAKASETRAQHRITEIEAALR